MDKKWLLAGSLLFAGIVAIFPVGASEEPLVAGQAVEPIVASPPVAPVTRIEVSLPQTSFGLVDGRLQRGAPMNGSILAMFVGELVQEGIRAKHAKDEAMVNAQARAGEILTVAKTSVCDAAAKGLPPASGSELQVACLESGATAMPASTAGGAIRLVYSLYFNYDLSILRVQLEAFHPAKVAAKDSGWRLYWYDVSFSSVDKRFGIPAIEDRRFAKNKMRLWFGLEKQQLQAVIDEGAYETTQMLLYDLNSPQDQLDNRFSWYDGGVSYRARTLLQPHGNRTWVRFKKTGHLASVDKQELAKIVDTPGLSYMF